MGKILSVLEKYKFIEKEEEKMSLPEDQSEIALNTASKNQTSQPTISSAQSDAAQSIQHSVTNKQPHNTSNDTCPSINYNAAMSLEEIYAVYHLNNAAVTETVFVLENLINALPEDLPEYVKKTTLNNILVASSMNLDKLLADGTDRYDKLNKFSNDYALQTESDIAALKQEINKLTALITDYRQQIKNKELVTKEQLSLIKTEEDRLQNILDFFGK